MNRPSRDKTCLQDLAHFGGRPLFERLLTVGRPNIQNQAALHERLQGAMDRHWLTNDGPLVQELERRFADLLSVPHCIAVSNATVGLQVAALALGIKGKVLLPSFTFVGTAHALAWIGLEPVFCDVHPADHSLDPADVERRMSPEVGAILAVHLWGRACQVEALQAVADRHGIPLLLDAAHALGCGHAGRPLGRSGAAEVFSLHATKAINSLEGGLITTEDAALAERVRLMRNFGFDIQGRVVSLGTNAKMNEFCAAAGLSNLEGFDTLREHNRRVFGAYRRELAGLPGLRLHEPAPGELFNYHYAVVELAPGLARLRDPLIDLLLAENVYARRYFHPGCHRSEPYAAMPQALPVTQQLSESLLQLPTGLQLDEDEAAALGRLVAWCVGNAPAVLQVMGREPAT